jgi:hypothetical protein
MDAPHTILRHTLRILSLTIYIALVAMPGTRAWAMDTEETRASLRGLPGVGILIGDLEPDIERGGVTKKQVQTTVERQLQQAGIAVLTREAAQQSPGAPFLVISLSTLHHSIGLYAYSIDVRLYQSASLVRDTTTVSVPTWSVASVGMVGSTQLRALVKSVDTKVEQFVRAYRTVNPRPSAGKRPVEPGRSADAVAGGTAVSQQGTTPQQQRMRQAQERLRAAGLDPGPADGMLGSKTREALRQYQRSKGLRTTGELDAATQKALGVR